MTARVPDGEQPVGGQACAHEWSKRGAGGGEPWWQCWLCGVDRDDPPSSEAAQHPRPRPAEPTVGGAELEALRAEVVELRAKVARVERLAARKVPGKRWHDDLEPAYVRADAIGRALRGD